MDFRRDWAIGSLGRWDSRLCPLSGRSEDRCVVHRVEGVEDLSYGLGCVCGSHFV
jgi:hypothetical protein